MITKEELKEMTEKALAGISPDIGATVEVNDEDDGVAVSLTLSYFNMLSISEEALASSSPEKEERMLKRFVRAVMKECAEAMQQE